jgi:hypothetical protein
MFTAYVLVTVLAAMIYGYASYVDFARVGWVLDNMNTYGVPQSWLSLLGVLKATAAVGLLIGLAIPLVGSAAAIGLVAYFVGACVIVLRKHCWSHIAAPLVFLLPAVASLALLLESSAAV